MTIGELKVRLTGETSGLQQSLQQAQSSMQAAGSRMQSIGSTLSRYVTAPLVAAGGAAVKFAGDYEQALTDAVAVTGLTGQAAAEAEQQMDALAKQLGRETAFSARESAEAMYDLASAGWTAEEMTRGLRGIMDLAAATQSDLTSTTETVNTALNQFSLETSESGRVADVFTAAITSSRTRIEDLATAMQYVGPVASSMGMSIEETTSAIALLREAGINASTAGTSLRMALASLAEPTGRTTDRLKQLGLSIEDVDPTMNEFVDIIHTLEQAGMTAGDAMQLFGKRAGPSMAALVNQGSDALREMNETTENSGDIARRVAEDQLDTLNGQLKILWGSIETAAITVAQRFLPRLTELTASLIPVVNAFAELDGATQDIIVVMGSVAAAIGPVLVVLGTLIKTITPAITALTSMGSALTSMGSSAAALAGGSGPLAALVAIAGALYLAWDDLVAMAEDVAQHLSDRLGPAVETVTRVWEENISFVTGVMETFATRVQEIFSGIVALLDTSISQGFKVWAGLVKGAIDIVVEATEMLWSLWGDNLVSALRSAWQQVANIVINGGEAIGKTLEAIANLLQGDFSGAWEAAKEAGTAAFRFLRDTILNLAESMLNGLEQAFTWAPWLRDKIGAAREAIAGIIDENLKAQMRRDAEDARGSVTGEMEQMAVETGESGQDMEQTFDEIRESAEQNLGQGGGGVPDQMEDTSEAARETANTLRGELSEAMETLGPATLELGEGFRRAREDMEGLGTSAGDMAEHVEKSSEALEGQRQVLEASLDPFHNLEERAREVADTLRGEFRDSVKEATKDLISGDGSMSDAIGSIIDRFKDMASEGIAEVVASLISGDMSLKEAFAEVAGAAKGVIDMIAGGGGIIDTIGGLIGQITGGGGLVGAIGSAVGSLTGGSGSLLSAATGVASALAGSGGGVMGAIGSVAGALGAGGPLAAGVAGGIALFDAFGVDVTGAMSSVVSTVGDAVSSIGSAIGGLFGGGGGGGPDIRAEMQDFFTTMESHFGGMSDDVAENMAAAIDAVSEASGASQESIMRVMETMVEAGEITRQQFVEQTGEAVEAAAQRVAQIEQAVEEAFSAARGHVDLFTDVMRLGVEEGMSFMSQYQEHTVSIFSSLPTVTENAMGEMTRHMEGAFVQGAEMTRAFGTATTEAFTTMRTSGRGAFDEVGRGMRETFERGTTTARDFDRTISTTFESVMQSAHREMDAVKRELQEAMEAGEISAEEMRVKVAQEWERIRREAEAELQQLGVDVDGIYASMREAAILGSGEMAEAMENASVDTQIAWEQAKEQIIAAFQEFQQAGDQALSAIGQATSEIGQQWGLVVQSMGEEGQEFARSAMQDFQDIHSDAEDRFSQMQKLFEIAYATGSEEAFQMAMDSADSFEELMRQAEEDMNEMIRIVEEQYGASSEEAEKFRMIAEFELEQLRNRYKEYMAEAEDSVRTANEGAADAAEDSSERQQDAISNVEEAQIEAWAYMRDGMETFLNEAVETMRTMRGESEETTTGMRGDWDRFRSDGEDDIRQLGSTTTGVFRDDIQPVLHSTARTGEEAFNSIRSAASTALSDVESRAQNAGRTVAGSFNDAGRNVGRVMGQVRRAAQDYQSFARSANINANISIPEPVQLAKGGVALQETFAQISESIKTSPEAVIPLSQIPDVARSMGITRSGEGGMNQTINIYLDGHKIAEATARELPEILDMRHLG